MSHASSREKADLQTKNLRKQRQKRRAAEFKLKEEMGEAEYNLYLKEKAKRSLKQIVDTAIWDIKHHQLAFTKINYTITKMEERLKEIGETTDKFLIAEKRKIEVALNGLRN